MYRFQSSAVVPEVAKSSLLRTVYAKSDSSTCSAQTSNLSLLTAHLQKQISEELQPLVEEWTQRQLKVTSVYGIRYSSFLIIVKSLMTS